MTYILHLATLGVFITMSASLAAAAPVSGRTPPESEVGGMLFAGASGIGHWKKTLLDDFKEYKVISKTCSGFRMTKMVDNIPSFFPCKPSIIVMQLGGNDLAAGKTPEQVCSDFKAFVEKSRAALPDVCILFMGLVPTVRRWDQAEAQKQFNQLVRDFIATQKRMDYIDVWDAFLGPDGKPRPDLFIQDGQHNNDAGYRIRVKLTRPYFKKWGAPARASAERAPDNAIPAALPTAGNLPEPHGAK